MSWLDRLREERGPEGRQPAEPAEAPSAGFAGCERRAPKNLIDMIGSAGDTVALHEACKEVDDAHARRVIDLDTADELFQAVRARLESLPSVPAETGAMLLAEFARSGRCLRIASRLLEVSILLAADNAAIPADNQLVVYRAAEIAELIHMPERLSRVHLVKKALDGEVIREEREEEGGEAIA
jgi:hypothetical protein